MRGRLASLGLLAASLAFSLGLGECALRAVYGPPVHFVHPQERYVEDPVIGPTLEPEQRTFTHDQRVQVNSRGLRDAEHAARVPEHTRRVVALGDSQTFGNGLALEDSWPKQLERRLDREGALRWQVLNAGISGTDTWQHEHVLGRVAASYEVDAVVLAFYVNDVTPRYEPKPAAAQTNTWSKRLGYLAKRSALFTLVWQTLQARILQPHVAVREIHVLDGTPDEVVEAGWEQVEASLASIRSQSRSLCAPFAVAVLPRRDQVDGRTDAAAYNERIAEIAARLGVPSVDLLEPLRQAYARHGSGLFIPWDGHNSAVANDVIARELAPLVRRLVSESDCERPTRAAASPAYAPGSRRPGGAGRSERSP